MTFTLAGSKSPPNMNAKCGMRRAEGECMMDVRIVNGHDAGVRTQCTPYFVGIFNFKCNEWPWQVGIFARYTDYVGSSPFCGGTLINEKYKGGLRTIIIIKPFMFPSHVITAAHCMPGQTPENTAIVLGDHDLNELEPAQVVTLFFFQYLLVLF